jgi:hypothetical protein
VAKISTATSNFISISGVRLHERATFCNADLRRLDGGKGIAAFSLWAVRSSELKRNRSYDIAVPKLLVGKSMRNSTRKNRPSKLARYDGGYCDFILRAAKGNGLNDAPSSRSTVRRPRRTPRRQEVVLWQQLLNYFDALLEPRRYCYAVIVHQDERPR